ncbi:MAG: gene transfer agent family protein [Pseudomonadota bacterium]
MANPHRGEISAHLDGKPYRLCLTLGALAELEACFGDEDMLALAERFAAGRLKARDAIRVLGAGLRGGGNDISDEMVGRMRVENGAAGFVGIVAELLNATFGAEGSEGDVSSDPEPLRASADPDAGGHRVRDPFPGMR